MKNQIPRPRWALPLAFFAGLFGLLTLKSGGEVLFIDGAGRQAAGNYMPFVVWFNFLAGFAYMVGAAGLALWRPWLPHLAFGIAILTAVVFITFGFYIWNGAVFEQRTLVALSFRLFVWTAIAFVVRGKIPE